MPEPATVSSSAQPPRALVVNLLSILPILLAVGVYVVAALRLQLATGDAVRAFAAILLTQVLPGAVVWRSVRPRDGWLLEDAAVGFAVGSALAVPAQVAAGLNRVQALSWVLPVLVAAVLLLTPTTRGRVLGARWVSIPWWLPLVIGVASLSPITQFRDYISSNRISWSVPGTPHNDAYLHLALSSELLHRGPVAWPTVLGEDLGYHWFTHAWIAQTSSVSGVGLDVVLLRVLPAFMPMAMALAVGVAALRLFRSPFAAASASLLTMVGGSPNAFGLPGTGLPINPLSPTLALGAPTLLALVTLLALRWRGEAQSGAFWLVLLLAIVAAGTKGSTVPIVVAGLGIALVAALIWNRALAPALLLDLLVVGVSLAAVMVVVFHGSSAGLALDIPGAAAQTPLARVVGDAHPEGGRLVLVLASAVLGGLLRAALGFLLLTDPERRRDPLTWTLLGAVAAGAGAVAVLSHPGLSQYYFLQTAIPVGCLAAGGGLELLRQRLGWRRVAVVLGVPALVGVAMYVVPRLALGAPAPREHLSRYVPIAVALTLGAAALGLVLARPRRLLGAVTGAAAAVTALGVVTFSTGFTLTPQPFRKAASLKVTYATSQAQIDAARWIRDHSDVDDVVMTNRHCTTPRSPFGGCDSRRWLVTAFSERQSLVEGWTATPEATRVAPHGRDSITVDYWKPDILRLNDGFYTAPSAQAQRRLWDLGVRWIYVENTIAHASTLAPYAVQRYANADASAWQLLPPS
jgi:hypothetical protein